MRPVKLVSYLGALQSIAAAISTSAQAQALQPVVPYNLGDAVRAAESARREQPQSRSALPEIPQTVEPQLKIDGNATLFIRHIQIEGPELVDGDEIREALAPYENRKLTLAEIYGAADAITNLYRAKGYLVARAYVPEQDARSGELKLKLVPGRYGATNVDNKSLVKTEYLKKVFDSALSSSPFIHKYELERAMLLGADTPGAGVPRIAIAPGASSGTSDLTFTAPGAPRFEGYLLGDNYGSPYTGRLRTSGGFTVASPTGWGDKFSAFGILSELGGLVNGRIAYSPPPLFNGLRTEVSIFETYYALSSGAYKDSGATGVANGFAVNTVFPYQRRRDESIYLFNTFTHKFLNDKVLGASTAYRYIDSGAVGVTRNAYGAILDMPCVLDTTFSLAGGYVRYPNPIDSAANQATIDTVGAYGRANLYVNATLGINSQTSFTLALRAQKSLKGNLDSSEKISLTGYFGVRSYNEGFAGDSGFVMTPELKYALPGFDNYKHTIGAFTDIGAVWLENPSYTVTQAAYSPLADIGLGYYASYDLPMNTSLPAQSLFLKAQVAHSIGSGVASSYNAYTKGLFQLGMTFAGASPTLLDAFGGESETSSVEGVKEHDEKRSVAVAEPKTSAPESTKGYYVPTKGYRLEPQPDIPPYVRNLGKTYKQFEGLDWLNVGLDSRTRFEYRQNDYRPWTDTTTNPPTLRRKYFPNSLWLTRTRLYLGIQDILDPFRAVVEFQDSRALNSIYEYQGQEIDETDIISAYGELYFKDTFGKDPKGNDRPLTVRAGRFHFELLDRRLIAENEFRNTTNSFEGVRVKIGKKENDWDLDSFFVHPVNRYPYALDQADRKNLVYGSVLSIRSWSEYATIQPYFLGRKQFSDPSNTSTAAKVHRETNAPGLRIYGGLGNFDFDFDINKQFGEIGEFHPYDYGGDSVLGGLFGNSIQTTAQLNASAYGIDAGYTFVNHPWKPRLSVVYTYGSGDNSPYDSVNQNFDTFYGFNQPFSRNDYFAWNNLKAPKVRIEFSPSKNLQIDSAFSAYWLASAAGAWDRVNLIAPLGNRGTFLGTEVDVRARYKLNQFVNLTASYARFWPGDFPNSFAPGVAQQLYFPQTFPGQTTTTWGLTSKPTDFFYLEATANAFGDGQPITKDPASEIFEALASDLKAPRAPSWRDAYFGLSGGGAWSNPQTIMLVLPESAIPPSAPVAAATPIANSNNHLSGFIGGFQLGMNWRFAKRFVLGLETDLHGTAGNTDTTWQGNRLQSIGNLFTNIGQRTVTLNYIGTVRGRLGFLPIPTLQIYGTGGMAYGGVIDNTVLLTQRAFGNSTTLGALQNDNTRTGWVAGAGVEWAFMPNWSAKAEYMRYDLGSAEAAAGVMHPNGFYQYVAESRTDFQGNLFQAGVNRHFELSERD